MKLSSLVALALRLLAIFLLWKGMLAMHDRQVIAAYDQQQKLGLIISEGDRGRVFQTIPLEYAQSLNVLDDHLRDAIRYRMMACLLLAPLLAIFSRPLARFITWGIDS